MSRTLKMEFGLSNGNSLTYDLADPKTGLTRTEVDDVMNDMIDKRAVVAGGFFASSIKDAYIREVNRVELD